MLSRLDRPGVARRAALGVLTVTLLGLLAFGLYTNWVPWSDACDPNPSCHVLAGESLAALESARYFVRDGTRYWLLQRHIEEGNVKTYFHNINLGAFVVYGTSLLGARRPLAAAILSAVAFTIGLAYAYLFVERASGSRRFALLFLVLFAAELYHNTLLGLNLLRAWHWLPLFGVAYHTLVIAQRCAVRLRDAIPLVLLATVGLGGGYEIFAFVGATAGWALILFGTGFRFRLWATLATVFAIPVILRQIQVIGGVGSAIWATDLYYTAGLKAPLLRAIFPLPPADEIDLWYRDNMIFRGAANSQPVSAAIAQLFETGRHLDWLRELGPLTLLTTLVGLILAVVLVVRQWKAAQQPGSAALRARTVVCLVLGIGSGFVVFGYHALYYFIVVHQLPLISAPVCLIVAFVASLLLDALGRPMPARGLAIAALVLLLGERLLVQFTNLWGMGLRAYPTTTRWGSFTVGPQGGMYGAASPYVLTAAGVVLLVLLFFAARAFLRANPPEPESRR